MFAPHMLLRAQRPLYLSPQLRAFTFARIALEPAKKPVPAPPPPPPPAPVTRRTTTKKVIVEEVKPIPRRRVLLSDKARADAAKDKARASKVTEKAKEKERAAKAKEKERVRAAAAKVREKERAAKLRVKEREKSKKEKEKELKAKKAEKPYPLPPKRAMSAYFLFASDRRAAQEPGLNVAIASTESGEAWKALSDSEKAPYNKKAEEAREKYKAELQKWISSLNLAQLTAARANREPGTRDDAALEVLPKRPGNSYSMFLKASHSRQDITEKVEAAVKKEADTEKRKRMMIGLMGKMLGERWRGMSDKEKLVYQTQAEDAKKLWDKNYGATITQQREAHQAATA